MGTAAMYYILRYLTNSDIVASVRGAGYLQSLMGLGCIVVAIFSAVLLLYANSFVMKRRQRELGLYHILGLEKRHIAYVMLWETLAVRGGGDFRRHPGGRWTEQAHFAGAPQALPHSCSIGFEVSVQGMWHTLCLFAVLFF